MSPLKTTLVCVVIAVSSGGLGFWWAQHTEFKREHAIKHEQDIKQEQAVRPNAASEKLATAEVPGKILYWYDPMVPDQHFDKPGKSPFMDMELVPKYGDTRDIGSVTIEARVQQDLAIRRATVEQMALSRSLDVAGSIEFDERNVAVVQSRSDGFVERVYAHAPGDVVAKNEPLADLLIPDWTAAQLEFLALKDNGTPALLDAARDRLRLLGMPADLIRSVEQSGKSRSVVTITSPLGGMLQTLKVRDGMSVGKGKTLARVAGINPVWLKLAVPESLAEWAGVGQTVTATLSAYPGEKFIGHVIALLPKANAETRTLEVRAEFANPDQRLRPGMYAQAHLETGDGKSMLWVPTEAVIRSGKRDVVIVDRHEAGFIPTEVEIGPESAGKTAILKGLEAGQTVVTSGQFLIDSEANLAGALKKLDPSSSNASSSTETAKEQP